MALIHAQLEALEAAARLAACIGNRSVDLAIVSARLRNLGQVWLTAIEVEDAHEECDRGALDDMLAIADALDGGAVRRLGRALVASVPDEQPPSTQRSAVAGCKRCGKPKQEWQVYCGAACCAQYEAGR